MARQHHIRLGPRHLEGNGRLGRYVLLPGDPGRAERIAERFTEVETVRSPRGHHAHLGRLATPAGEVEVLTLSTGIGAASTEVVVHELLAWGARRIVRVGSCGTMTPDIRVGQVVVALGAVRDEATTGHYAPPEYPALAHPAAVAALSEGAHREGLAADTFRGLCHSKDSLYGREFGHGPAGKRNLDYCDWLRRCGVIASEMECSTLFVLAATAGPWTTPLGGSPGAVECQAGAVLAVFGTDDSNMGLDRDAVRRAEERAIRVALAGVGAWAERDGLLGSPAPS